MATSNQALHIERMQLIPPASGLDVGDLAGMMTPETFAARAGERSIDFDEYRKLVRHGAYISQSVRPWQHYVHECLLWASLVATDETLRSALTDVGLDKRLASSQEGLDTALHGSPSRLSGGELQRLLLAQVILRQPFLALLDEATSEIVVLSALKRQLPQTILIVVSHRTGVAAIADQCLHISNNLVTTVAGKADLQHTVPWFGSSDHFKS